MEKYTASVILIVALIFVGAYLFVNFQGSSNTNVISVNGISEIKTQPEIVSVYVSVEALDDSAEVSKNENADISEKVINQLVATGINKEDIQTQNFNVYEEFDWLESGRKSKGWKTVNSIVVKTTDFDKTGEIVDIVVDNGGLIQSINFEISQARQNELKAQALKEAAEDAQNKAEALATGSGGKLGKLVSLSSQDFGYYPYPLYARAEGVSSADAAKEAATNISPQELTITASVQASYKLR